MKRLGDVIRDNNNKVAGNDKDYQAEPIERAIKSVRLEQKLDPYVARATERAKIKIRNRIFLLSGGHVN
jgi:hypothetical protein